MTGAAAAAEQAHRDVRMPQVQVAMTRAVHTSILGRISLRRADHGLLHRAMAGGGAVMARAGLSWHLSNRCSIGNGILHSLVGLWRKRRISKLNGDAQLKYCRAYRQDQCLRIASFACAIKVPNNCFKL